MLNAGWLLELKTRLNKRPPPSLAMKPGRDWLSMSAGMTIFVSFFLVSVIHVWYILYSRLSKSCFTTDTKRS